jgi:spore coat polysaccharide biosynthesis protein SpsF (cytidylyltransferase family)
MICIQIMARMASERAPGKSCADLAGKAAFVRAIERVIDVAPRFEEDTCIVVNTTTATLDDPIALLADAEGCAVLRYPEETPSTGLPRVDRLCRDYGLGSDDIMVWLAGDSPFDYMQLIPLMIKALRENDCDRFVWAGNPAHTLIWGVGWPVITTVRGFDIAYKNYSSYEQYPWWTALDGERLLTAPIPERLKQPWPWRKLTLDYPLQVTQAKLIYEKLYQGKPLSIWGVYDLMNKEPAIAHLADSCPDHKLYGQHLDWFWEALEEKAVAHVEIPEKEIV